MKKLINIKTISLFAISIISLNGYGSNWQYSRLGRIDYKGKTINNQGKLKLNKYAYRTQVKSAEYPGGEEALQNFFKTNINYPKDARDKNIQGNVEIHFYIDNDGSIKNVDIMHSPCHSISVEAERIAYKMQHWLPAKMNGFAIKTEKTIFIKFHL